MQTEAMTSAELQSQELVHCAINKKVAIDWARLVRYARIKVAADNEVLNHSSTDQHAKAAIYYRVATYYGLDYEKVSANEIRQTAARGRQALSQIGQSAKGVRIALN